METDARVAFAIAAFWFPLVYELRPRREPTQEEPRAGVDPACGYDLSPAADQRVMLGAEMFLEPRRRANASTPPAHYQPDRFRDRTGRGRIQAPRALFRREHHAPSKCRFKKLLPRREHPRPLGDRRRQGISSGLCGKLPPIGLSPLPGPQGREGRSRRLLQGDHCRRRGRRQRRGGKAPRKNFLSRESFRDPGSSC
jgi:hypothetical protein